MPNSLDQERYDIVTLMAKRLMINSQYMRFFYPQFIEAWKNLERVKPELDFHQSAINFSLKAIERIEKSSEVEINNLKAKLNSSEITHPKYNSEIYRIMSHMQCVKNRETQNINQHYKELEKYQSLQSEFEQADSKRLAFLDNSKIKDIEDEISRKLQKLSPKRI